MPSANRLVILEDVLDEGRVCLKAIQKSLAQFATVNYQVRVIIGFGFLDAMGGFVPQITVQTPMSTAFISLGFLQVVIALIHKICNVRVQPRNRKASDPACSYWSMGFGNL